MARKKNGIVKPEPVMTAPQTPKGIELPTEGIERMLSFVASKNPWLKKEMKRANMTEEITAFVGRAMLSALGLTAVVIAAVYFVSINFEINPLVVIPTFIISYPLMTLLTLQEPKAKANRRRKNIDKDILFAGRHLWISLKGGVPLFDSLLAISRANYGEVSREMKTIAQKVLVGVPLDTAMQEVVSDNPSPTFRRMMMQIVNSVRSGADVADSLGIALEQIAREQLIDVREYGQRLNPVVMFYMVMGVIFPSLGISVGILLLSFAGVGITINEMWALLPIIAIIQYMFLSFIDVTRPVYEV